MNGRSGVPFFIARAPLLAARLTVAASACGDATADQALVNTAGRTAPTLRVASAARREKLIGRLSVRA
jgi:hypothetical protein